MNTNGNGDNRARKQGKHQEKWNEGIDKQKDGKEREDKEI